MEHLNEERHLSLEVTTNAILSALDGRRLFVSHLRALITNNAQTLDAAATDDFSATLRRLEELDWIQYELKPGTKVGTWALTERGKAVLHHSREE